MPWPACPGWSWWGIGPEESHVSGGVFVVEIAGEGLELRAITGLELLITGKIQSIRLA